MNQLDMSIAMPVAVTPCRRIPEMLAEEEGMALRLVIIDGDTQVYAYRKGVKRFVCPCVVTDLGVRVYRGRVYPPYQSIYSWMKFLGGYWRKATAEDASIPNIEELALKAERLGKPVDVLTGEAVEGGWD